MEKECTKCKEVKSTSEYYKDKRAKDGCYSACKSCCYFNKSVYNGCNRRDYMKNYLKDPERHYRYKIRQRTNSMIRRGKLTRQPCEVCKSEKVEAHHEDYNIVDKIKWLCVKHHSELHSNQLITN